MHQRRRLQGMTREFAGHPMGSKRSQFVIDERKQPIRGGHIAVIDRFKQKRYLRHREFLPLPILQYNAFMKPHRVTGASQASYTILVN
jgi:hypothetical protein